MDENRPEQWILRKNHRKMSNLEQLSLAPATILGRMASA